MAKQSKYCKELMVKELSTALNNIDALIVTNYKGLNAHELDKLRSEIRNVSGDYLVVKDSIAKKALADSRNNRIVEFIEGEVGIVLDRKGDPANISKVLERFKHEHQALEIRGGIMNGALISKDDIVILAKLPSREILLQRLAGVLNAPMQNLACALNGIITKLAYALSAIKEQRAKG